MHWLALASLVAALIAHEMGHALAMISRGIEIKEFGIGLPLPLLPRPTFRLPRHFGGAPVVFNWLPVMAYVYPGEKGSAQLKTLPYGDQALIYGAGALGNIIFGLILFMAGTLFIIDEAVPKLILTMSAAALLSIIWLGRRQITKYAFPFLSLTLFGLIIWRLIQAPLNTVAGPVGIASMAMQTRTWVEILDFSISLNFGLAVINLLPISFLDGGKIFTALFKMTGERSLKLFHVLGAFQLIGLLSIAMLSDISRIIR